MCSSDDYTCSGMFPRLGIHRQTIRIADRCRFVFKRVLMSLQSRGSSPSTHIRLRHRDTVSHVSIHSIQRDDQERDSSNFCYEKVLYHDDESNIILFEEYHQQS